jgi:Tol biopolymer transport system component
MEHRRRYARLGWLVAGVLAALLAAFGIFHYRTAAAPAKVLRFEIPAPEGTSWGPFDFPALSPDGSRIMFGATKRDGTRSLWIRPMDSVSAQPIPGTEGSSVITGAWSPDGRSIAYVADGKLRRLEMTGGSPQILSSLPARSIPAWSSAGVILFADVGGRLYQVSASGGEAKAANVSGASSYGFPSFFPDGRRFLYCRGTGGPLGSYGLFAGALDSKEEKSLTAGCPGVFVPPAFLLKVRDSTLEAQSFDPGRQSLSGEPIPIADQLLSPDLIAIGRGFSVSQNGVVAYRRSAPLELNDLTWYDRQGKRLGTVGEPAPYTNPALSPDGKRLAVSRYDTVTNTRAIWLLDLAGGVSSRFTFDKSDATNPAWSPDGSRIAFTSTRKQSSRDIFWKAAGGGADELLLEDAGRKAVEHWSPDGKLLLFNLNSNEIDALPLSGDRKPYPVLRGSQVQGCLSPDGHWIAYSNRDFGIESGRDEIFVQTFPPAGGKWQITRSGGTEPSWSRDGTELYFLSGTKLVSVEVKAAGPSFEWGVPKVMFDVPLITAQTRRNRYVVTADGQRFLFVTTPKTLDTTPFVVVQNWQIGLKH